MARPNFPKQVLSANADLGDVIRLFNQLTGSLSSVFDNLASPLFGAILLQNIVLQPGLNQVQHTLGKNLTSYIICAKNAPIEIFKSPDPNALPGSYLQLLAGGTVTIDLLVF